jgi:hypothetical protein
MSPCLIHGAATANDSTHLLLADERAPQHANLLAHHAHLQIVICLEPRHDVLQSGIIVELKPIPKRPLGRTVFVLLGSNRF